MNDRGRPQWVAPTPSPFLLRGLLIGAPAGAGKAWPRGSAPEMVGDAGRRRIASARHGLGDGGRRGAPPDRARQCLAPTLFIGDPMIDREDARTPRHQVEQYAHPEKVRREPGGQCDLNHDGHEQQTKGGKARRETEK